MNLVRSAEVFATMAHSGQTRWDKKTPFITHPAKVVSLLKGFGITDKEILAAAWLHDVEEDTQFLVKEEDFSKHVVSLVKELTFGFYEKSDEGYLKRCGELSKNASIIKICDIIANLGTLSPNKVGTLSPNKVGTLSAFVDKRLRALSILIPRVIDKT